MKAVRVAVLGLLLTCVAAAARAEPPRVVATVPPLHSLVAGVMAGLGEPELLLEGAASPHSFQLRPSQARMLEAADVVFRIGPGLETALEGALATLAADAEVVATIEAAGVVTLPTRTGEDWQHADGHGEEDHAEAAHQGEAHRDGDHDADEHHADASHDEEHHDTAAGGRDDDHAHGPLDQHIWLDPENAKAMAAAITEVLARHDPPDAGRYRDNAAALAARIDELAAELAARLAPLDGRPYVVFHDGYQYLERRFGLDVVGAVAVDPERQPSAGRVDRLRARIAAGGAVCVFSEPQFPPRLVATLIEGTGARAGVLDPLGADLARGPDLYFALMRRNAEALAECLAAD